MEYIYICIQTACDEERAFEGEKIPLTPIFLPLGKLRFTNAAICYIIISAEVRKLKVKIVTDEELPADTVVSNQFFPSNVSNKSTIVITMSNPIFLLPTEISRCPVN